MKKAKTNTLLGSKPKFALWPMLILVGVLVATGIYFVSRIFAASGSLTLLPSATAVNIGDTVTVVVRANSGTDLVNFVEADLVFDATKLQYVSVNETGTAFPLPVATIAGTGTLNLARSVQGGSAPVSGDNLVTTVTFKALAAGSVPITFATGSIILTNADNTDILVTKNGTTLTLSDMTSPTIPAGLIVSGITMTSMNLAWSASTDNVGVTSYRIYRNGTSVGTSTTNSFALSALNPGTTYSLTVSALDAVNHESAQSPAIIGATLADSAAPTVPGKPTSASQTMTSITLAWAASTDNVAVTGYKIYRNGAQIATSATANYVDNGLSVNTIYAYTVAAYDAIGNTSAQSASTSVKTLADTLAPTVPTSLSGSATAQAVTLNWAVSTDNVGVTGYIVYSDGVQIATSTVPTYSIAKAATGNHVYTVAAQDAAGNTSAQSTGLTLAIYSIADINRDFVVNGYDLNLVLVHWLQAGVSTYDINGDQIVNGYDLSMLLTRWGN